MKTIVDYRIIHADSTEVLAESVASAIDSAHQANKVSVEKFYLEPFGNVFFHEGYFHQPMVVMCGED